MMKVNPFKKEKKKHGTCQYICTYIDVFIFNLVYFFFVTSQNVFLIIAHVLAKSKLCTLINALFIGHNSGNELDINGSMSRLLVNNLTYV